VHQDKELNMVFITNDLIINILLLTLKNFNCLITSNFPNAFQTTQIKVSELISFSMEDIYLNNYYETH
jgi:hypothetical protein